MTAQRTTSTTVSPADWRELAVRDGDGLAVTLAWSRSTARVKVAVVDERLDQEFEFDVAAADALAAFHHPFAYAAGSVARFREVLRETVAPNPQADRTAR